MGEQLPGKDLEGNVEQKSRGFREGLLVMLSASLAYHWKITLKGIFNAIENNVLVSDIGENSCQSFKCVSVNILTERN